MPFLPTTKKECQSRGWDELDVILFSGDAYVDHPAFGVAVIGRVLEAAGYRVAIVPQPDWHGDYRDFTKLGQPRLFFAIAPGAMDSMVCRYTAARRLRSDDAYTPDARHDRRPERPTIVYTHILKQLYPDTPVVIGGIEASMRRLTHYDYWDDALRPPILIDSHADLLIYGMGERPIRAIADTLNEGKTLIECHNIPQVAYITTDPNNFKPSENLNSPLPYPYRAGDFQFLILNSHEVCLASRRAQAENFATIERESNSPQAATLVQQVGQRYVVVNPPYPTMTTAELDAVYDLPYQRTPHPKYAGHRIPAYEMIRHSITLHRGCFGGCAFCTISAHQGKAITSRSKASILREAEQVTRMPDFSGYISDLGGPSANMYGMHGRNPEACAACHRPSCLFPRVCPNLNADHTPLLDIYHAVDALPAVKKSFVGSGVRYDLLLNHYSDPHLCQAARQYTEELITRHVSGRLKVAPEHTADRVLKMMRKPPFALFEQFKHIFDTICQRHHIRQQLIPYFISSHPACTDADMRSLAELTRRMGYHLEQVQDFTPTPMTLATEAYYTGLNPETMQPIFCAQTPEEKRRQNQAFFWYKTADKPHPRTPKRPNRSK